MHGSILAVIIPSGNPRDEFGPSGPGMGIFFKRSCPGGSLAGQIEITTRVRTCGLLNRMAST